MSSAPILRLQNLVKKFGEFTALHAIDLDITEGEFLTIVGPSGSGKSTLIRLLVGMDEVTCGTIELRGLRIDQTPANERPTCMVFQSLALFPHMTVGQNIEFPLKIRGVTPAKRKERALELLETLRLPQGYYDKGVTQCSGGERQRVALARALAFDPEILFFDEPLSALDYRLRKTLEKELKDLHNRTGKTFVYITHSLEEAMVMSDRIAIMKDGRFEQIATADEIYSRPISRFVAKFMGEVNLFEIVGNAAGGVDVEGLTCTDWGGLDEHLGVNEPGALMVRPEFIRFLSAGETADFTTEVTMLAEYELGSRIQYEALMANGTMLTIEKLREDRFTGKVGDRVWLGFSAESAHVIRGGGDGTH